VGREPKGWTKLRDYQKDGALVLSKGIAGLWWAPGTGKTSTALAALAITGSLHDNLPYLVVTRPIGRYPWVRDSLWVLGADYVPAILWGGKARSADGVHRDGSYSDVQLALSECPGIVTNYDILGARVEELLQVGFKALILDEAHHIKGGHRKLEEKRDGTWARSRCHYAKELALDVKSQGGIVLELTATAVRDRRRDLWSQLDTVLPGRVLPNKRVAWHWVKAANDARDKIGLPRLGFQALYPMINGGYAAPGPFGPSLIYGEVDRVEDGEALGVPVEKATSFMRRFCAAQQGIYGLETHQESMTEELEARCAKHFSILTRTDVADQLPSLQRDLRRIPAENNVSYKDLGGSIEKAIARAAAVKAYAALELASEYLDAGGKVVITTCRRRLAHRLFTLMEKERSKLRRAIRESLKIECVTGEINDRKRVLLLDNLNNAPGPTIVIATDECMGESIDMHYFDACVVAGLPYTPGRIDQLEGRFVRLGGTPCTIHYLIADDTIDERIRQMLLSKLTDVVQVGANTSDSGGVLGALKGRDEKKIIADLRGWLNSKEKK